MLTDSVNSRPSEGAIVNERFLSDGYMFQKNQADAIDADVIEADFEKIIDHWERVYSKVPDESAEGVRA